MGQYWWVVLCLIVGLMSGALSLVRDFISLYRPEQTLSGKRRTFWALVRIAFVLSAFFAWFGEHRANQNLELQVTQLRQELSNERANHFKPQLKFNVYNGGSRTFQTKAPT